MLEIWRKGVTLLNIVRIWLQLKQNRNRKGKKDKVSNLYTNTDPW